ncbi:MAG: sigma-70 family RNA polymerase sigma factor [Bacteroidota bacterium]
MEEDIKLINATLKGDQFAFQHLVEKYQHYVFTITYRVLKRREEAEETAQDVFIKVYKTLGSFEQRSKFTTWLYAVTYRTALDKARKKNYPIDSIDDDDNYLQLENTFGESPSDAIQQEDLQSQLERAISRLKPVDASLITLFYLHEKSIKEIAAITGLTISNIKTKLHRLREQLKVLLEEQLQQEIHDLL